MICQLPELSNANQTNRQRMQLIVLHGIDQGFRFQKSGGTGIVPTGDASPGSLRSLTHGPVHTLLDAGS
jgi:hypothetical protein